MKVLVTGCYGFIGYSVTHALLNQGHSVIGVDRVANAISEKGPRIASLKKAKGFTFLDADLSAFGPMRAALLKADFDSIVHLAGQYSKPYTEDVMIRYLEGNVLGWTYLMHVAHLKGIRRVVYASSTHVPAVGEPTNLYGATLKYREIASPTFNGMGIETVAIRYSMTYGPYMRADSPPAQIMRKLHKGQEINVDGEQFRYGYAWIYIDDAVELTIRALTAELPTPHVTLTAVADDYAQDLGTCVRNLEKATGIKANIKGKYQTVPAHKPEAEIEANWHALKYRPTVKAEEGLKRYGEWYLTEGHKWY